MSEAFQFLLLLLPTLGAWDSSAYPTPFRSVRICRAVYFECFFHSRGPKLCLHMLHL